MERLKITVLIPVYDDWSSLEILLTKLDSTFINQNFAVNILIVDDGSPTSHREAGFIVPHFSMIEEVSILELKRNLGHQRAIALGLTYIEASFDSDATLVMDADGEDKPDEALRLIQKCANENFNKIVFARRSKRSEDWKFRLFYWIYKKVFWILTGNDVRFGNFSVVPARILKRLVVISESWNHYAAATIKARLSFTEIDTSRGVRLDGESKMNFVSLIIHGLSAISVFGEVIGVRLLISTFILTLTSALFIFLVLIIKFFTTMAIPGWATYVTGMLIVILLQSLTLSIFFSFLVLTGRDNATFLPQRDYHYFISEKYTLYQADNTYITTQI